MTIRSGGSEPSHAAALLGLHVAVLLFGFAGLFGKWLSLAPGVIVLGRTLVASIALGLVLRMTEERLGSFEWRLGVNGGVLALHWVSFFQAIQVSTVAVALLGFASFPLFVLLLETTLLRRRLRVDEWATAALVTAGLLLLVPEFRLENRTLQGLLWGIVSGFSFALLAVCNKALAGRHSAGQIAFWQNACAALCLLPVLAVAPSTLDARSLMLLAALGVLCTALAHTLFIRSLRALSAHTASVVAALEPVYGIVLAFLLLGEIPPPRTIAGGALIVGAAMLGTVRASRPASPA
jgi:drug/metabolite transporter (DMT)-like permease